MLTKIRERTEDAPLRVELQCGEADFRTLAEAIASGIFIGQGQRLHYVNHAAETITGYSRQELLSMSFWDLVHADCGELVSNREGARQGDAERNGVKILTKNGDERWLDISTTTIEFDGMLASLVSAFDVTERKLAEEKVQLLAVTDPLTGLGNYRRFADVLRVDCRAIDTAARYGGDEFVVILPETTAAAARLVASRIRSRLAADSLESLLSASIGVAVYPQDGETIEALLRTADRELYAMKPA